MKNIVFKICVALASVAGIAAGFVFNGIAAVIIERLGFWGYPANFCFSMLLCGFVLVVLPPSGRKEPAASKCRRGFALDENRFKKEFWVKVRKRGPFALVLVANLLLGPFVAALVIRWLGYAGKKSWLYAATTTLVATIVWVSIYLGVIGWARSLLASMF